MRIAVADTPVPPVNDQLTALIACDFAPGGNGFSLRPVSGSCTLASGATHSPSAIVGDYVLVAFRHDNLLIYLVVMKLAMHSVCIDEASNDGLQY